MRSRVAIGIDLGGTTLSAVLVDRDGTCPAARTAPAHVERGTEPVMREMVALTDSLLEETGRDRRALIGVGVAAPGPLSHRTGRLIWCGNLPGWVDVPLRDRLHQLLDLPVVLENDGNAAAFGEYWVGAGDDGADLVMLTLGTGVGGGVIINGAVLRGHFENAAELGHMIVVHDGLPCTCGQRGCLEQYASASAVARRVEAGVDGGAPSALTEAVQTGRPITAEAVAHAARAGDVLCSRVWDEACLHLGVACVNIQHAFNPRRIVLGGGMSRAGPFLVDRVRQHMRRHGWTLHDDIPDVVEAKLGCHAGAIGAAGLIWRDRGSHAR